MTNPKTGWMTREWVVEIITSNHASSSTSVFSSQRLTLVSEAYPLSFALSGTVLAGQAATVIAHDVSFPPLGTVGATQAATLGPQQFLVGGPTAGTQVTGLFALRGR